jgi:hypothetical protein
MRCCVIGIVIGHGELAWGRRRTGCWLVGVNCNYVCGGVQLWVWSGVPIPTPVRHFSVLHNVQSSRAYRAFSSVSTEGEIGRNVKLAICLAVLCVCAGCRLSGGTVCLHHAQARPAAKASC